MIHANLTLFNPLIESCYLITNFMLTISTSSIEAQPLKLTTLLTFS